MGFRCNFNLRNLDNFLPSFLKPKARGAAPALLFSEMGLKGNFKFWRSLQLKGEVVGVDAAHQPLRKNARNRHGFALERLGDEFRVFGTKNCEVLGGHHGLLHKRSDLLLRRRLRREMLPSEKTKQGEDRKKEQFFKHGAMEYFSKNQKLPKQGKTIFLCA